MDDCKSTSVRQIIQAVKKFLGPSCLFEVIHLAKNKLFVYLYNNRSVVKKMLICGFCKDIKLREMYEIKYPDQSVWFKKTNSNYMYKYLSIKFHEFCVKLSLK